MRHSVQAQAYIVGGGGGEQEESVAGPARISGFAAMKFWFGLAAKCQTSRLFCKLRGVV